MCRINPKVDLVFKKLFGSEENKDILQSLINALLPREEKISQLELKNPYNLADYIAGKLSILDIKAVDEKGKWYDIEMQVDPLGYYGQKALFYWGKVFTAQIDSGELYSQLNKTILWLYDNKNKEGQIEDYDSNPEQDVHSRVTEKMIQDAISKLSPKFRQVIILRDIQGFSYEEISEMIHVPLGTVKSRVNRGRLKLQEDLSYLLEDSEYT